jgi:hypothetical protein
MSEQPPQRRPKRRFWRIVRIYFRRFRITVWLVTLLVLGAFIYVNQVGLPGFVKNPLLENLRARGLDLQFSRLRVRWYQGIVADNVRFGQSNEPLIPQLTAAELQLHLDAKALTKFQVVIDSVRLRQGTLTWPIPQTNLPPRLLVVDNIQTQLRFLPNDQWLLDHFTANFAGAQLQLSGSITNASAVRDLKLLQTAHPAPSGAWQKRLGQLAETVEKIQFPATPEFRLDLRGDGRDIQSFEIRMLVNAPGAKTPWGTVTRGRFNAHLFPATNEQSRADLHLDADEIQTRWANTTNVHLAIDLFGAGGLTNQVTVDTAVTAGSFETQWARATNAHFSAQWVHSLTNAMPWSGHGKLSCEQGVTEWGSAARFEISARFARPAVNGQSMPGFTVSISNSNLASLIPSPVESWTWWTNVAPYLLDWECRLTAGESKSLSVEELAFEGNWRQPHVTVTNLHSRLLKGQLDGSARLNVATSEMEARVESDIDPLNASSLLTEGGRQWFENFAWPRPPQAKAEILLRLPAWTNSHPDWRGEVLPTLQLLGEFKLSEGGSFRGIHVDAAQSHFSYSNMCWRLPDFQARRPEGSISAEHQGDDRGRDFYWRFRSTIDPRIVMPLLSTNEQRVFDFISITQPPAVDAELWGRWHDPERIGVKGSVSATNFVVRGVSVSSFVSGLEYTNRFLLLTNGRAQVGTQELSAASFGIDFVGGRIFVTNGFGKADPALVTGAIGSNVAKVMEPYQFARPPSAKVWGVIPIKRDVDADLHFQVDGGPFHWWRINATHLTGNVHWVGDHLSLENVKGELYGGQVSGFAQFDFHPSHGADLQMAVTTTNMSLRMLMTDLSDRSNRLEGSLSGTMNIAHANTADWHTMNGYGSVDLRDGLIWEIPVFGVFSPVLNGISPGLGNSRASAGDCDFVTTNGVFKTDDLEIHSSAMRLQYKGSVDLESRVNARVEAEWLHDLRGVGPLISTVFWPVTKMLEYRVTGTLSQPKTEPLYLIPRIVLMPFHPFRTIKDLLPDEFNTIRTNNPSFRTE